VHTAIQLLAWLRIAILLLLLLLGLIGKVFLPTLLWALDYYWCFVNLFNVIVEVCLLDCILLIPLTFAFKLLLSRRVETRKIPRI
jgi:hypothetical protein